MSSVGWTRRSSALRASRISNSNALDLGARQRRSRSPERHSRIPLRSSSQSSVRDKFPQGAVRSRSQVCGSTPLGRNTLVQFPQKITPSASSNMAKKKMAFHKDTRKLQDTEFLKEASGIVQNYFQHNCPEVLINGTDIRPMTIKMFIAMINHLFEVLKIYDKGKEPVKLGTTTYEKELPYWLKKLEYPGLLNKAWLQTVNVPQNWPHVIGLLSWLVKLVIVSSLFNFKQELQCPDDEDATKKWALYFFEQSLKAFKEKDTEVSNEIWADLQKKLYEMNQIDEDQITALQQEVEELESKLNDPNEVAEKDAFDEAEQRLKVLQDQHQKNIDEISKVEDETNAKKTGIAKAQRNIAILKEEIEKTKRITEELKKAVSKQSVSSLDPAEIQKKSDFLDKEIKCLEKECEDYSQLISKYELETAEKRDKILQSTHICNRNIIQLEQMIPELKNFHIHMDLENPEFVKEMEQMVKSLEELKIKYNNRREELQNDDSQYQKNLESKKQILKELTDKIEILKSDIKAKEKENESQDKQFRQKEEGLKKESENIEEKIKAMREKLKSFDEIREKKKAIEAKHESLVQTLENMDGRVETFWAKVYEQWKNIPKELESCLNRIISQNLRMKKTFQDLNSESEKVEIKE